MLHYVFASFFKETILAATDMNSEEKIIEKLLILDCNISSYLEHCR